MTDIGMLLILLFLKDAGLYFHSLRVGHLAALIGEVLGLGWGECFDLFLAGCLHDLGKLLTPDEILLKVGALTDEERRVMRSHVEAGVDLVTPFGRLGHLIPGLAYHHQRFDGGGYAAGPPLSGQEIPLYARILAVVDSLDAMAASRCYRPGMSAEQVIEQLHRNAGQWDPEIVGILIAHLTRATDSSRKPIA